MKFDICSVFILQGFFLIIGVILRVKIPPINDLWGYKTRRASRDAETWKYANKLFAILLIIISLTLMVIGSILLICKYILNVNIGFIGYLIASVVILGAFPILITETTLPMKEKKKSQK